MRTRGVNVMENSTDTLDVIGYIQKMEYENTCLKEEISIMKARNVDAHKFYAVAMSIKEVAALHDVSTDTVRKYVEFGLIERHPKSTDGKVLIRVSDALLLDFKELRRRCMYRHCTK